MDAKADLPRALQGESFVPLLQMGKPVLSSDKWFVQGHKAKWPPRKQIRDCVSVTWKSDACHSQALYFVFLRALSHLSLFQSMSGRPQIWLCLSRSFPPPFLSPFFPQHWFTELSAQREWATSSSMPRGGGGRGVDSGKSAGSSDLGVASAPETFYLPCLKTCAKGNPSRIFSLVSIFSWAWDRGENALSSP